MAETIIVPDFDFSGLYYAEILEALIQWKRINVPEITNESDKEPFIQLLRAYALVGHLNSGNLDYVAKNCFISTTTSLEALRQQLKLTGVKLRQASPAQADIILTLSKIFTPNPHLLLLSESKFSTIRTASNESITFEYLDDGITIDRTDQISHAFFAGGGLITGDKETILNQDSTFYEHFLGDFSDEEQNMFYVSHNNAMWNKVSIKIDPLRPMEKIKRFVLEYYSGNLKIENPNEVVDLGDSLKFTIDNAFGLQNFSAQYENNFQGINVRITYNATGAYAEAISQWDGVNNYVEIDTFLGQVSPSTKSGDYSIGMLWRPIPDATLVMANDKFDISYSLPETSVHEWSLFEFESFNGWWVRVRVVELEDELYEISQQSGTSPDEVVVQGTYSGTDHEDYVVEIKTPHTNIALITSLGSPNEASLALTSDWTGEYYTTYVCEVTTAGAYGVFEIQITRENDDIVVLTPVIPISGVIISFDRGLEIVFNDGGGSIMQLGEQWRVTGSFRANVTRQSDLVEVLGQTIFQSGIYTAFDAGLDLAFIQEDFEDRMNEGDTWLVEVKVPTFGKWERVRMDEGGTFVKVPSVQGTTIQDQLANVSGEPNQEFVFNRKPLLEDTDEITFGTDEARRVDDFLNSTSVDLDYIIETDAENNTKIKIGDGVNGLIPHIGVATNADYRIGGDSDGNVGANSIIVNTSGIAFVSRVSNPRSATGWAEKEGSSTSGLEQVKLTAPAEARTLGVALTLPEIENFAVRFISEDGTRPVIRSIAVEEAYGVKTVGLVVVGVNGDLLSSEMLSEINDYFNPDGSRDGILVLNHRVYSSNYSPKLIDIEADVVGGNKVTIENALKALLRPDALSDDGVTYEWDFGEDILISRLIFEIFKSDSNVTGVTIATPTSDIAMGANELPTPGTITINIV